MKLTNKIISISASVMLFVLSSTAQISTVKIDPNKAEVYLSEVQLNCPQYVDSILIEKAKEKLSRVLIHLVPLEEHPECKLLSNIPLKNKCNNNLQYDIENFNPETFNPLKYQMSFHAITSVYYRVDGTDYIIEVKPVK